MKWMRKLCLLLTCLCVLFACALVVRAEGEVVASGVNEYGVTWTAYDDATLVFEGNGPITEGNLQQYQPKKVVLGAGITSVEPFALSYMSSLEEVQLNEGLQTIQNCAFFNSINLQQLTIPASVTTIKYQAFGGCRNLTTLIFKGLCPKMEKGIFLLDESFLKPVTAYYPDDGSWKRSDFNLLGSKTTWIPYTLDGSGNMVPNESRAYVIDTWIPQVIEEGSAGDGITYQLYDDDSMVFKGTGPMTSIGTRSISASDITKLRIKEGITAIPRGVFDDVHYLRSLDIAGSVSAIEDYTFNAVEELSEVILRDGVKEIGTGAFQSCPNLKTVTVSGAVTHIKENAFADCNNLSQITYLGAPPAIHQSAFGQSEYGEGTFCPLMVYYPNDGSWSRENMVWQYRTTTYIPYTTDGSGNRIPDTSRAYVAEFVALTEGNFASGGSWKIDNGVLYISGQGAVELMEDFDYDLHWASVKEVVIDENVTSFSYSFSENLEKVTFLGKAWEGLSVGKGVGEIKFYYPANDATWTQEKMQGISNSSGAWIPYTLDNNGNRVPDESNINNITNVIQTYKTDTICWTLYSNGTVKAEGSGLLEYYPRYLSKEWEKITRIEIGEGFTAAHIEFTISHDKPVELILPSTLTTIHYLSVPNVKHLDLSNITRMENIEWSGGNGVRGNWLESITLSTQLTEIPEFAFAGLNLKSIVIPDSVTVIGGYAFDGCTNLANVQLGKNLQTIGPEAFRGCVKITEIALPEGLQTIDGGAFRGTSLKKVVLPKSVSTLGPSAFEDCQELTSIHLSEGIVNIYDRTFANCKKLAKINIPDSVTYVWNEAFQDCESLKSLDLNNADIDFNALDGQFIEHLILGTSMESIYESHIKGSSALKSVVIPSGVIQSKAFSYCENLESVTLGDGVSYVHDYAFKGCGKLKSIDLNCITDMGWNALSEAGPDGKGLEHITFSKNQRSIDSFSNTKENLKSVTIPEGVEKIGQDAFYGYPNLTAVVLPDSLTEIGYRAFQRCENLENVTFGKGLTFIDLEAFAYCKKLKEAVFQENLQDIQQGAFYETGIEKLEICAGVTRIGYYVDFEPGYGSVESDLPTFGKCVNLKSVVLPEDLMYIPDWCFYGCENLESVVISNSVTKIGNYAFYLCENLQSVTLGSELQHIGYCAFMYDAKLKSIVMQDKVDTIRYEAFYGCTNLTEVRFSKSLGKIGDGAFASTGIKEAIMPDTLQALAYEKSGDIALGTFSNCENLEKVQLLSHPNFHRIPERCFAGCVNLKSIEIPDSIMYLDDHAFSGSGLSGALTIPFDVEYIGDSCFSTKRCSMSGADFSQVIFTGYCPEVLNDSIFYCGRNGITFYYPQQWKHTYFRNPNFGKAIWIEYTTDENGEFILADSEDRTEEMFNLDLAKAKQKYPEGFACDQYSVAVLYGTGLRGYGSQAFAYFLSNELFGGATSEVITDVNFADVKLGDILRMDNDTRAVVVTEIKNDCIVAAQGDWNGTVHWGETLTKDQVEAADYRITRYGHKVLSKLEGLPEYEPQIRPLVTDVPTEQQAYERITAMKTSFPEGYPFGMDIWYDRQADYGPSELDIGQACAAFCLMATDTVFGTAPLREFTDIRYEDIMVGDLLHYDPDSTDSTTHIVMVWKVYSDCLVTVEGNYGGEMHWGSVFTKEEVENMMGRFTAYPEGSVPGPREEMPKELDMSEPYAAVSVDEVSGKPILTWTEVGNAVEYRVYRADAKSGDYVEVVTVTQNSYTDSYAPAGKTFYYKVRAVGFDGTEGTFSAIQSGYCTCAQPVAVASNDPATGTPGMKWDAVDGAQKYAVYRATAEDGAYTKVSTTTALYYYDAKAEFGTSYYYKVKALASDVDYDSVDSQAVCCRAILAQPILSVAVDSATGKPSLSWKKVTGAVSYDIYRAEAENGEYTCLGNQTALTFVDTDAAVDVGYWYKVRAIGAEEGMHSSDSEAKMISAALAKPVVTFEVDAASGKPTLSWDAVAGAVEYTVYRSTSATKSYKAIGVTAELTYIDASVSAGKSYYYKVMASGENSQSEYSAYQKLTGKCAQPEITVEANASGKPVIKWSKVTSAKKYTVYRATSETGKYTALKTVTSTSYTDTSAKQGSTYYYKVKALASKSTYNSVDSAIKSCTVACAQPALTVKVDAATGKAALSWKKITGAVSYDIYRATAADGEFEKIANQTEVSYKDLDTAADTDYWYKVQAIAAKEEMNSNLSAAKKIHTTLAKPVVTFAIDDATGKPMLTWEEVEGAVEYQVYRSTKSTSSYKKVNTTTDLTYMDTSVGVAKGYYYKVIAVSENVKSAYSAYKKLTAKCAQPVVTLDVNDNGQPVLKWEKIAGASKYTVYRTDETGEEVSLGTTTKLTYTDKKAAEGATYTYRVRANGSKSTYNGVHSEPVIFGAYGME